MFAKWFGEYQKIVQKTRIFSQIAIFSVSIFTFLSLFDWLQIYLSNPKWIYEFRVMSDGLFDVSITIQAIVVIIFSLRFGLSFFKTKKIELINIGLYLVGMLVLVLYLYISEPVRPNLGIYSTYNEMFAYTSRGFDFFALAYMILSPLRQIITIIFAILKSK